MSIITNFQCYRTLRNMTHKGDEADSYGGDEVDSSYKTDTSRVSHTKEEELHSNNPFKSENETHGQAGGTPAVAPETATNQRGEFISDVTPKSRGTEKFGEAESLRMHQHGGYTERRPTRELEGGGHDPGSQKQEHGSNAHTFSTTLPVNSQLPSKASSSPVTPASTAEQHKRGLFGMKGSKNASGPMSSESAGIGSKDSAETKSSSVLDPLRLRNKINEQRKHFGRKSSADHGAGMEGTKDTTKVIKTTHVTMTNSEGDSREIHATSVTPSHPTGEMDRDKMDRDKHAAGGAQHRDWGIQKQGVTTPKKQLTEIEHGSGSGEHLKSKNVHTSATEHNTASHDLSEKSNVHIPGEFRYEPEKSGLSAPASSGRGFEGEGYNKTGDHEREIGGVEHGKTADRPRNEGSRDLAADNHSSEILNRGVESMGISHEKHTTAGDSSMKAKNLGGSRHMQSDTPSSASGRKGIWVAGHEFIPREPSSRTVGHHNLGTTDLGSKDLGSKDLGTKGEKNRTSHDADHGGELSRGTTREPPLSSEKSRTSGAHEKGLSATSGTANLGAYIPPHELMALSKDEEAGYEEYCPSGLEMDEAAIAGADTERRRSSLAESNDGAGERSKPKSRSMSLGHGQFATLGRTLSGKSHAKAGDEQSHAKTGDHQEMESSNETKEPSKISTTFSNAWGAVTGRRRSSHGESAKSTDPHDTSQSSKSPTEQKTTPEVHRDVGVREHREHHVGSASAEGRHDEHFNDVPKPMSNEEPSQQEGKYARHVGNSSSLVDPTELTYGAVGRRKSSSADDHHPSYKPQGFRGMRNVSVGSGADHGDMTDPSVVPIEQEGVSAQDRTPRNSEFVAMEAEQIDDRIKNKPHDRVVNAAASYARGP
ncbi:LAME_0F16314g1_1 [Lachancea meyersii CBS 8951]|uniref:LAME_0F16314g1_1 n=1 Tax=Lachancea meyersii CBS 8951 TaxID=1266667 RepID=A0A1G4JZ28_9SACH|nr:LAME_0F16314g1_1 [Lachancea meyersii CBS 8951]